MARRPPKKTLKWTIGTLFFFALVSLFTLNLFLSNVKIIVETVENNLEEPTYPIFKDLYDVTYTVYTYFKTIVTSPYGLSVLIALSLIILAMEVEWKRRS